VAAPAQAAAATSQINVWLPIVTFFLGAALTRLTMSKAERANLGQLKSQRAADLANLQNERTVELLTALTEYSQRSGRPTLSEFLTISAAANKFLYQQKVIADAVLSDRVDATSRDNTLVPSLKETAERLIPRIYETLKDIAEKNSLPYPDDFKRENYEGIFAAVEKYGNLLPARSRSPGEAEVDHSA
jgi:hypothetical protein